MKILVACEVSGRVRDAFIAKGHDAISCDILPSTMPGPHIQDDVTSHLSLPWDLVIAFPPCTDLTSGQGGHQMRIKREDGRMAAAADFFLACYNANAPQVAVENPIGAMSTRWRKPDQIIDPWWFGDPYRKRTCLWLRGLPLLVRTHDLSDYPEGVTSWVTSGSAYNRGVPSRQYSGIPQSARNRNLTFPGVASAMAEQWGSL